MYYHLHFTGEKTESVRGGNLFKFTIASKSIPVPSPPEPMDIKATAWNKNTENTKIESNYLPQNQIIFNSDIDNDTIINTL